MNRHCIVRDLGRMSYAEALSIQESIAGERKLGLGADHLLFVEHPHVVTIGRNGSESNVLASPALLRERGVEVYESDRGGDVTYHGPGQIVAYPVMDLREWKRDVGAFVRAIEQTLIDTLEEFSIQAYRIPKLTLACGRRPRAGQPGVCEDCGDRSAFEPLGFDAWLGAECDDGFELLRFDCAVRADKASDVDGAKLGVRGENPEDVKRAGAALAGRPV